VERLLKFAPAHLLWAVELAFNLGVRVGPSELLALKWHDMNWADFSIRVYSGKTKTERTVYFNPVFVARLLEMQGKAQSPFLVEYRGEGIKSFRKSFKAACVAAGIEYTAVPYDLRHLYATTAITNGADIGAVSKQMGHATVKMTVDTYLHVMEEGKRKVASVLPSLKLPEAGSQAVE
jgi:integrase